MLKDFKAFIMRGSMLELAVAVVIAAAFGAVIKSLVDDVIMPPVGLALGNVDFSDLHVVLREGTSPGPYGSLAAAKTAGAVTINYGLFLNTVIGFVIVAAAVFILVRAASRMARKPAPDTKNCPFCVSSIPLAATRCPSCTSQLG